MSLSPSDIIAGINFVRGVASKVKDNQTELRRVSDRLQHVLNALQEIKQRDLVNQDEYNDALFAIFNLVQRAQRATQKQLKRSLGARIWSRDDIATELRRICDDIDIYLTVHTIRTLDVMHASSDKSLTCLSSNVEEIMVKLAEIDMRLNTPAGPKWSPSIVTLATDNIRADGNKENTQVAVSAAPLAAATQKPKPKPMARVFDRSMQSLQSLSLKPAPRAPEKTLRNSNPQLHALAQAGRTTLRISSLQLNKRNKESKSDISISVEVGATLTEIKNAIQAKGFALPDKLEEEPLLIMVTDTLSEYDATAPGGLQIAKDMPLLWWWNKYNAYHGIAPATTPGHTLAAIDDDGHTITAAGVEFQFHRTLRVPDTSGENKLPLNLGKFPLLPVAKFAPRLPESIRKRGGFFMPMFEREALWISFELDGWKKSAIKVSVGGVNAITGVAKDSITPITCEQDYIVAGLQKWLDGIVTESGVVRQFVAMKHGQDYTVEEQVTGKAEFGGFQFDVFPRRDEPGGHQKFCLFDMDREDFLARARYGRALSSHMTPAESDIPIGSVVGLYPKTESDLSDKTWSLATYRRRIGREACLVAVYIDWGAIPVGAAMGGMGLGAGGKISQKIYKDPVSPRMYDEDNGQRFHVHILTPDVWETVMGVLPPITPITTETYQQHNIPWYTVADDHIPSLDAASQVLGNVQSVAQLDKAKQSQLPDLVDPSRPPVCSLHARSISTCLFRPCGHMGCSACLGQAMLKGSCCPKCAVKIKRFVGMKDPVAQVSCSSEEDGEGLGLGLGCRSGR